MSSSLAKGDRIIEVKDTQFAAALAGIGIPCADPANPCTLFEDATGKLREVWQFAAQSSDRQVKTESLLEAQADPEAWVCNHSGHPLAFALCALVNHRRMAELTAKGTPLVGFSLPGGKTIYVFKGSRKHRKLVDMGVTQL
jgi:hypothetical protein